MHENHPTLIALAFHGDEEAFRVLVERHSRHVYQVAYRLTGHALDAEDVVQETFLRAHRQLRRFEGRADVRTWLHRIAMNCAIDLIRARRHREKAIDPAELEVAARRAADSPQLAAPDRVMHGQDIQAAVTAALGRLTPLERGAFVLRHIEGLSIREIAEALGVGAEATKHSIFRAVRKMRVALEPLVDTHTAGEAAKAAQR